VEVQLRVDEVVEHFLEHDQYRRSAFGYWFRLEALILLAKFLVDSEFVIAQSADLRLQLLRQELEL
jgi:hypothetical protein